MHCVIPHSPIITITPTQEEEEWLNRDPIHLLALPSLLTKGS